MNGLRSLATFGYPIKSFETGREMETITVEASALHPPPTGYPRKTSSTTNPKQLRQAQGRGRLWTLI